MELEFYGVSVQVLLLIFDEFLASYNDPSFVDSLKTIGRKEVVTKIEDKQREIFIAHNVDATKGIH
jgi:hypothetical protein